MHDRSDREITPEDSLNPEQRAALVAMADKRPVHRALTSKVSISTVLTDSGAAEIGSPVAGSL